MSNRSILQSLQVNLIESRLLTEKPEMVISVRAISWNSFFRVSCWDYGILLIRLEPLQRKHLCACSIVIEQQDAPGFEAVRVLLRSEIGEPLRWFGAGVEEGRGITGAVDK